MHRSITPLQRRRLSLIAPAARGQRLTARRAVAVACFVLAVASMQTTLAVADSGEMAERRTRIEQMEPAAKEQLQRKYERFAELDPAERERMRALHEQIQDAPDRAQLEQVMQQYSQWLSTLTSFQRAELAGMEPTQRVQAIKKLRSEQAKETAQRLDDKDFAALSKWFEQRLLAHLKDLPEPARTALEKPGPHDPYLIGWLWMRRGRGNEVPAATEQEIAALRETLSPKLQEQLDAAKTTEAKQKLVRDWSFDWGRQVMWRGRGGRHINEEVLREFAEKDLTDVDRERLSRMSGEDMKRELRMLYYRKKLGMPDWQGGPFPRGPREGGGPRNRPGPPGPPDAAGPGRPMAGN